MRVQFATSNEHKVAEARGILDALGWEVERIAIDYPEVRSPSVEDVALDGARYVADKLGGPVIVEDTGLFIRALKWFPGTYSKYVLNTVGVPGVLRLMERVDDRYAEFRCAVGFCEPGGEPKVFAGVVPGTINHAPLGDGGFGYDPIFITDGENRTFAQMPTEDKNAVSHRRRALTAFVAWAREEMPGR
jgi:XTP/dITP diphosphohydrolase